MATSNDTTALPVDLATMRTAVNRLLDPDSVGEAMPPAGDKLDTLTLQMRGHIELLAPEVEQEARALKADSVARYTVLGCVWEARSRLEAKPTARSGGAIGHARRMARVLNALCDHYERIGHGDKTPAQFALLLLGVHSATCSTCRTSTPEGVNLGIVCEEGERLFDEYRKALRVEATSSGSAIGH